MKKSFVIYLDIDVWMEARRNFPQGISPLIEDFLKRKNLECEKNETINE